MIESIRTHLATAIVAEKSSQITPILIDVLRNRHPMALGRSADDLWHPKVQLLAGLEKSQIEAISRWEGCNLYPIDLAELVEFSAALGGANKAAIREVIGELRSSYDHDTKGREAARACLWKAYNRARNSENPGPDVDPIEWMGIGEIAWSSASRRSLHGCIQKLEDLL